MHLESNALNQACACELVGMRAGSYLIVRIPEKQGKAAPFTTIQELRVKYILSDDVFGFDARVLKTLEEPEAILFLDYPEEVENINIRADRRVECFLPISLELADTPHRGTLLNINKSGCLCRMEIHPSLTPQNGNSITLHLPYGPYETVAIQGDIRSCRQVGSHVSMGIQFQALDGFAQKLLTRLVPNLRM